MRILATIIAAVALASCGTGVEQQTPTIESAPTESESRFDGRWKWQVNLSAQCSSAFFEDLNIRDGKIEAKGRDFVGKFTLTGNVTNEGKVSLIGFVSGFKITASGTLDKSVGQGEMLVSGPDTFCNRPWEAERAG